MKQLYESILDKIDVPDEDLELNLLLDPHQTGSEFIKRLEKFQKDLVPVYKFQVLIQRAPTVGQWIYIDAQYAKGTGNFEPILKCVDITNKRGYAMWFEQNRLFCRETLWLGIGRHPRYKVTNKKSRAIFDRIITVLEQNII